MQSPTLFRPEALADREAQWFGTVLLAPRLSYKVFAAFALVTTLSIVCLLIYGVYPRKVRIAGWIVPENGLVRVFAPRSGVVTGIYTQEGAEVHEGDRLVALSSELESTALGATRTEEARRLSARRESLLEEKRAREGLDAQEAQSLRKRLAALTSEQAKLDGEIALQVSRLQSAEQSVARREALQESGIGSAENAQAAVNEKIDQGAKLRELERSRWAAERARLELSNELNAHPLEAQSKIAAIDREVDTIEQELAEVEAQRELVVSAATAGTVTAIQVDRGSRADVNVPLLSIVPAGSQLEAQMFCPSRAIAFLKVGQRVLLRYQAYPYEKFGHYEGVVKQVSRSAVNPRELPAQLSGLTSLIGSDEPVYRLTVGLASQTVTAYGQQAPLTPGMLLQADVIIEQRRVGEWVLEPLRALTGTWAR